MAVKKQRPLATLPGPLKAKVYQANFRPFESTKYLDEVALQKVEKTTIEIGTVEAPGVSFTLAAEIQKGMITRLMPVSCGECKPGRVSKAKLKRILAEATKRLGDLKTSSPNLPMPLALSRTKGIVIGPIVIVVDEGIPCVWIWIGQFLCIICEFGFLCGV
jgi:hypothetical protein